MGNREKHIINDLLLKAGPSKRLFRANSGLAWTGAIVGKTRNTVTLLNPRPFHGMPKGTPDLIGWESKTICEILKKIDDHFPCQGYNDCIDCDLTKKVAIFTAIEVKTGRVKTTEEQNTFIKTLNEMGGRGIIYHE